MAFGAEAHGDCEVVIKSIIIKFIVCPTGRNQALLDKHVLENVGVSLCV